LYLIAQEHLEFLPGVKKPTHHGSDGNPQRLGHFAIRQSAIHVQDERLTLALRKPDEGAVDLPPEVGTGEFRVRGRQVGGPESVRVVTRRRQGEPSIPLALAAEVERGVAHDPEEPGLERTVAAKSPQIRERLDESILDGVERIRFSPQQPVRHAVRHAPVSPEEIVQRGSISRGN
jgi:hypothetical protein